MQVTVHSWHPAAQATPTLVLFVADVQGKELLKYVAESRLGQTSVAMICAIMSALGMPAARDNAAKEVKCASLLLHLGYSPAECDAIFKSIKQEKEASEKEGRDEEEQAAKATDKLFDEEEGQDEEGKEEAEWGDGKCSSKTNRVRSQKQQITDAKQTTRQCATKKMKNTCDSNGQTKRWC